MTNVWHAPYVTWHAAWQGLLTCIDELHTASARAAHCFLSSSLNSPHLVATMVLRSLKSNKTVNAETLVHMNITWSQVRMILDIIWEEEIITIDTSYLLRRRSSRLQLRGTLLIKINIIRINFIRIILYRWYISWISRFRKNNTQKTKNYMVHTLSLTDSL